MREAGHALRAAHYEYELACKERMLELERKKSALLRSELERAWALLDQPPELESAWKGMQNTQTEEQPAGPVLWDRAGRWVSGEHESWDVEEGAGEEVEEEVEEEEETLWDGAAEDGVGSIGRTVGRKGRGERRVGRGDGSARRGGDAVGECRQIAGVELI